MRWLGFSLFLAVSACHSVPSIDSAPTPSASAVDDAASPLGIADASDIDATITIDAGPPAPLLPKACGTKPQAGLCATEGLQCNYASGFSCRCQAPPIPASGPCPDCPTATRWSCRHDGCPMTLQGACEHEGQHCHDDTDQMCVQNHVCKGGKWQGLGQPSCRPAAPPHH
ncbi:MAG: hypothetical protein ABI421_17450 [Polyangiaceae bacterium]